MPPKTQLSSGSVREVSVESSGDESFKVFQSHTNRCLRRCLASDSSSEADRSHSTFALTHRTSLKRQIASDSEKSTLLDAPIASLSSRRPPRRRLASDTSDTSVASSFTKLPHEAVPHTIEKRHASPSKGIPLWFSSRLKGIQQSSSDDSDTSDGSDTSPSPNSLEDGGQFVAKRKKQRHTPTFAQSAKFGGISQLLDLEINEANASPSSIQYDRATAQIPKQRNKAYLSRQQHFRRVMQAPIKPKFRAKSADKDKRFLRRRDRLFPIPSPALISKRLIGSACTQNRHPNRHQNTSIVRYQSLPIHTLLSFADVLHQANIWNCASILQDVNRLVKLQQSTILKLFVMALVSNQWTAIKRIYSYLPKILNHPYPPSHRSSFHIAAMHSFQCLKFLICIQKSYLQSRDTSNKSTSSTISHCLLKRDKMGRIPLHLAVIYGFPKNVNLLLLYNRRSLFVTDRFGYSVFHMAAEYKQLDCAMVLLKHLHTHFPNYMLHSINNYPNRALLTTIKEKKHAHRNIWEHQKAAATSPYSPYVSYSNTQTDFKDIDPTDFLLDWKDFDTHHTALMIAVKNNDPHMCRLLFDCGLCALESKDRFNRSAVHYASLNNDGRLMNILLSSRRERIWRLLFTIALDCPNKTLFTTLQQYEDIHCRTAALKKLQESSGYHHYGVQEASSRTTLQGVSSKPLEYLFPQTLPPLLTQREDWDPPFRSETYLLDSLPLNSFCFAPSPPLEALVEHLVNEQDAHGRTPVHYAALSGCSSALLFLLEKGGLPNVKDHHGSTPLHYAVCCEAQPESQENHSLNCIQNLITFGAQPEVTDENNWPPILYADFASNKDAVLALLKHHPLEQLECLGYAFEKNSDPYLKAIVCKLIRYLCSIPSFFGVFNEFLRLADPHFNYLKGPLKFILQLAGKGCGVLSFEIKCRFSKHCLSKWVSDKLSAANEAHKPIVLKIHRGAVFNETLQQLNQLKGYQLFRHLSEVKFYSQIPKQYEEGYGLGVIREYWSLLADEIHRDVNKYFCRSSGHNRYIIPKCNSADASFFKGIGRLFAFALYNNETVEIPLAPFVWDYLLYEEQNNLTLEDLQEWDPQFCANLKVLLEGSNDVSQMLLTFTAVEESASTSQIIELKPDGSNIDVTQTNKEEYIQLMVNYKLREHCKKELQALRCGFVDNVEGGYLRIFTARELDLLVAGKREEEIDVADWEQHTEYIGYGKEDCQIIWFWRFARKLHPNERRLLLRFGCGISKNPEGGFRNLLDISGRIGRFRIAKAYQHEASLPTAATCSNTINLPPYASSDTLEEKLFVAIRYGNQGFAFR